MRRIKNLFVFLCATVLLASCGDIFEEIVEAGDDQGAIYVGDIVVDQNDGTQYVKEDVEVGYLLNDDGTLTILMKKVKFASAMPAINMEVPGVTVSGNSGAMTLTGDGIVPIAMGGEFKKFTITNLVGAISAENFDLSFTCGDYPVTYSGYPSVN